MFIALLARLVIVFPLVSYLTLKSEVAPPIPPYGLVKSFYAYYLLHIWYITKMPYCHCDRRFSDLNALQQHQSSKAHCYCRECARFFVRPDALKQHRSALHSFTCVDCDQTFVRPEALQRHQKSTKHCYCCECDRFFVHLDALEQHRSAFHSFTCIDCNRIFVYLEALQQHQRSTTHGYCRECNRFFVNSEALGQHLQSPVHAMQFHCCDCDRDFVHEQALHQHLADKIHKPCIKPEVSSFRLSKWVCEQCDREFRDEKGLEQHRLSVVHKPLSNIKCIGDRRCKKQFTSPSAWLHHLESGACPPKITRDKLHSAVQSNDINRLITGDSIQEYTVLMGSDVSGTMSITGSVIFTPITDNSLGGFRSPSDTWEPGMFTPNSGNSQPLLEDLSLAIRLTCPLCPFGRKPFKSLEAMKDHLSSPAHSPKIFHCPLDFVGLKDEGKVSQLMRYFSTLSGLMQHLESGACQGGGATFRKTVEYIEHNLGKMGLRKLRLLN